MAEYRSDRPRTSPVWQHFEIKDTELCVATCNHCQDIFSYRTSTSNLFKHLENKHNFKEGEDVFAGDAGGDEKINKHKLLRSQVWEYFEVKDEESKLAICNLCSEQFSYRATSANLGKHLKGAHGVHLGKTEEDVEMEVEKLESEDEEEVAKVVTIFNERKGRQKSSAAWDHFTILNTRSKVATCNLCGTVCSYRTSVSNLMKHVRRKHDIVVSKSEEEDDDERSDVEVVNTRRKRPAGMTSHRSVVWLYFKCVDPETKLSQCLICKKLLSHSTTLTNLKKHLARKHPDLKIPNTRQDGTKRILISSGGELYEVETKEDLEDNDDTKNDTVEMDTIYLDEFDGTDHELAEKKPPLNNTAPKITKCKRESNAYNTSSDEEVTFVNKYAKKQCDSLDYFGRYIASLLKQLPNQISNQLQTDFVKQIMNAQLTYETQKSQITDTDSNAYSITITAQDADQDHADPKHDVLESIVENNVVNEFLESEK